MHLVLSHVQTHDTHGGSKGWLREADERLQQAMGVTEGSMPSNPRDGPLGNSLA